MRFLLRAAWRRDGVITIATPWMTAQNPFYPHPGPFSAAMLINCFQKISGTRGFIATAPPSTTGPMQKRPQGVAVTVNKRFEEKLQREELLCMILQGRKTIRSEKFTEPFKSHYEFASYLARSAFIAVATCQNGAFIEGSRNP